MSKASADSARPSCCCNCHHIPGDPRRDSQATATEKQGSQPMVETKIFPAPKRHCTSSTGTDDGDVKRAPPTVQVIKSTNLRYEPEDDYKMTAKQRGNCLIINNVDFELEFLPKRKGSDRDAYRFRDIFKQLGFEVDCKRNLTAEKMNNLFNLTAARCVRRHDALVVIILSHGSESGVYGVDGIEVDLNDMLSCFDNKKCKQMMGKPKIFIVQACRGRQSDYGVRATQAFLSQPESQGYTQPSQLSELNPNRCKISRWSEIDREYHPTRTDMILCFSCHVGFGSIRNEDYGSWLGTSLAQNLEKGACGKHLMEIFNMVSRDVRLRQSADGHKQVLEITTIGFDRNLYFNPGLYESEGVVMKFQ